jgi:hypothetical protein
MANILDQNGLESMIVSIDRWLGTLEFRTNQSDIYRFKRLSNNSKSGEKER